MARCSFLEGKEQKQVIPQQRSSGKTGPGASGSTEDFGLPSADQVKFYLCRRGLPLYIGEDGRIHGKFNQTITATGRISSTEPNLQNIPVRMELGRPIRKVFVPKEGYVFTDADYSQIELRILAHMSGDERLIERPTENPRDIHATTASQVFHVPLEEVTPLQRRNAKAVNFGVYGISALVLAKTLSISRKEAKEYIERYFETYPKVKEVSG